VIGYGPDELHERQMDSVEDLRELRGRWPVLWVDVTGLADVELLEALGGMFGLHKLALEDVVNTFQRPKLDVYVDNVYFAAHMLNLTEDRSGVDSEQVSLFLGSDFVITAQERPGDCFEPVRRRLREKRVALRGSGPDYLFYAIIDSIVDHYFPMLEELGDGIERLEEQVLDDPSEETVRAIRTEKRILLALRRFIWPLRDAVSSLARESAPFVTDSTRVYLHDCHDHCLRILELTESYREQVTGLNDTYMSSASQRMNEVMAVLTIVATIFIPLSFIAGVYGMNFDPTASRWNMPEVSWRFGYLFALGLMAAVAGGMLLYFRYRGWIGRRK
jgi:magnesium transporter